jgi:hypothetical protein
MISIFVIFENEIFFEYSMSKMSSNRVVTKKEKKNSINVWILSSRIKITMSFDLRRKKMIDLNEILRFLTRLINFQVFWASSMTFSIVFRWFRRRIFLINRFLSARVFFHRISVFSMFDLAFSWFLTFSENFCEFDWRWFWSLRNRCWSSKWLMKTL